MKIKFALFGAAAALFSIVPLVPASAQNAPTPIPITVMVDGLEAGDEAVLRIGVDDGTLQLSGQPLYEYTVRGASQQIEINPTLEDGGYLLVVDAPDKYFREPRGYLFVVYQGAIVNPGTHQIRFQLIPPSARNYEPYRGPTVVTNFSPVAPTPNTGGVTYRTEGVISPSAPPKAPIQVSLPSTAERMAWQDVAKPVAALTFLVLAIVAASVFLLRRAVKSRARRV